MGFAWQANDIDPDEKKKYCQDYGLEGWDGVEQEPGFSVGDHPSKTQKETPRGKKRKNNQDKDLEWALEKAKKESKVAADIAKSKRPRILIGIDHGTTHSGASFSCNIESVSRAIYTIQTWSDSVNYLLKMPSVIAYANENKKWSPDKKKLARDVIGHEVKAGMVSYTWWKLLLDVLADPTEFDDPHLDAAIGKGTLCLPSGKSAIDVASDFLRIFRELVMRELVKVYTEETLSITPIEFWYTRPAIWDDRAQMSTEKAVRCAGFYTRPIDKVNFMSEAEAAAVTAFKQEQEQNPTFIQRNMLVIIADIGGGTVDVEGLEVKELQPLRLEATGVGFGGKCGSTTIDRGLIAWCEEVFGQDFTSIPKIKRGPGSPFLEAFEAAKRRFQGNVADTYRIPFPVLANKLLSIGKVSDFVDEEEGELILPGKDMVSLFKETLNDTKRLIEQQAHNIREIKGKDPHVLILAGGLAQSQYVYQEIQDFANTKFGDTMRLLRPNNAWGAISYGAVAFGLERTTVFSRVARRHYAIVQQRAFREGIDPEARAVMLPTIGKRVDGELLILLHKGEAIREDKKRFSPGLILIDDMSPEARRFSWNIICSNKEGGPPKYADDPGCYVLGSLEIDLKNLYTFWSKKKGYSSWNMDVATNPAKAKLNITVSGGHAAGTFSITARAQRQIVGELVYDYST